MFSLRRLLGATALAATVLGLAACGDVKSATQDVSVDSSPIAVQHAAATTATQPTTKVDTSIVMTINGRDITVNGTGQLDSTHQRFSETFDATDMFASLVGAPPPGATAPITVVADGPTVYAKFPGASALTNGKPWMKFDASASRNQMADLLGGTGGGAFTSDPSSFLRFLQGAGKVTEVGQESLGGTPTTHYNGTYTINDALISLSQDERDRVTKAFDRLGFALNARDEPIAFDVWIGADGLVRRVSSNFDMTQLAPDSSSSASAASSSPQLGNMTVTVDYSDFGAPVDIQIPPDDQVQDLATLVPTTIN